MDKLKNFIDSNRETFDDELLPEGHLERFTQKLPAPRKNHVKLYSLLAFATAACITLFLLLRLPGGTPAPVPLNSSVQNHGCKMKTEIEELRLYYNMQMNEVVAQMDTLYKQQQTPGAKGLLKEMKQVLKDNYMFEETVLPVLPCSDEALFAMNQHYSSSLESLNIMLEQLERLEKTNKKNTK